MTVVFQTTGVRGGYPEQQNEFSVTADYGHHIPDAGTPPPIDGQDQGPYHYDAFQTVTLIEKAGYYAVDGRRPANLDVFVEVPIIDQSPRGEVEVGVLRKSFPIQQGPPGIYTGTALMGTLTAAPGARDVEHRQLLGNPRVAFSGMTPKGLARWDSDFGNNWPGRQNTEPLHI